MSDFNTFCPLVNLFLNTDKFK